MIQRELKTFFSLMQFFDENEPFDYDEPVEEPVAQDDWQHLTTLLDNADDYRPFDLNDSWDTPPERSSAVIRIIFRRQLPSSVFQHFSEDPPTVYRRTNTGTPTAPYLYTDESRNGLIFLPEPDTSAINMLTWQPTSATTHVHPESQAIEWLKRQRQVNPLFADNIQRVQMLIQDQPCKSCLNGLKSSMGQVLPAKANVRIRWIKPRNRFASFRERRYQPKVNRWSTR